MNKSLIIVGASGVGKGTLIKNLQQRHPNLFALTLSFTTRPIRLKQINNVHYIFLSNDEFQEKLPLMLENKTVHRNRYGTSAQHLQGILFKKKIPILDIDVEGMLEIRNKIDCQVLCIMPASWELLEQRLKGRGTQSKQVVERRMKQNKSQVQRMMMAKGRGNISYVTNYQYQLTTYGVELWLEKHFERFRQYQKQSKLKQSQDNINTIIN